MQQSVTRDLTTKLKRAEGELETHTVLVLWRQFQHDARQQPAGQSEEESEGRSEE